VRIAAVLGRGATDRYQLLLLLLRLLMQIAPVNIATVTIISELNGR